MYAERKLEWALHYPSAVASWSSVYAFATKGCIDIALPAAEGRLKLTGRLVGTNLFVTGATLVRLVVQEEPFEFAQGRVSTDFLFHGGLRRVFDSNTRSGPPPSQFDAFREQTGGKPLSNKQWMAIESIVEKARFPVHGQHEGRRSDFPLRQLFDILSAKFGTPTPWAEVNCPRPLMRAAQYIYLRLVERGCWDQVTAALART